MNRPLKGFVRNDLSRADIRKFSRNFEESREFDRKDQQACGLIASLDIGMSNS